MVELCGTDFLMVDRRCEHGFHSVYIEDKEVLVRQQTAFHKNMGYVQYGAGTVYGLTVDEHV